MWIPFNLSIVPVTMSTNGSAGIDKTLARFSPAAARGGSGSSVPRQARPDAGGQGTEPGNGPRGVIGAEYR